MKLAWGCLCSLLDYLSAFYEAFELLNGSLVIYFAGDSNPSMESLTRENYDIHNTSARRFYLLHMLVYTHGDHSNMLYIIPPITIKRPFKMSYIMISSSQHCCKLMFICIHDHYIWILYGLKLYDMLCQTKHYHSDTMKGHGLVLFADNLYHCYMTVLCGVHK